MAAASIPLEIVEEILLNLPVKSLLRFSTVSKSWNSMIFDAGFIRRHKSRAALPGREKILIRHSWSGSLTPASTLSLSSLSSNQSTLDAAPHICLFNTEEFVQLLASCGDLWCVEHERTLFLWNPSMRTYRKLPHPSVISWLSYLSSAFSFGVGYDSFGDDYKILKIPKYNDDECWILEAELYSLRSNLWRKIKSFPLKHKSYGKGVFVSGALHWMSYSNSYNECAIISFDLSTEKYAEVALTPFYLVAMSDVVELTVLREKLCLYLNYYNTSRFVLWEMQEYGDGKSWTKMFEIDVWSVIPYTQWRREEGGNITFTPLYLYDNGMILIKCTTLKDGTILMYRDEQSEPQIVSSSCYHECTSGPLYVESLVSPATYCGL